jgi:hypothetical protein
LEGLPKKGGRKRRLSLLLLAANNLRGEWIGHGFTGGRVRLARHQFGALGQVAFEHLGVVAVGVPQLQLDGPYKAAGLDPHRAAVGLLLPLGRHLLRRDALLALAVARLAGAICDGCGL